MGVLLNLKTRGAARRRGVRYSFLFMRASGTQLDEITKLVETNVLRPIVDRAYPPHQGQGRHRDGLTRNACFSAGYAPPAAARALEAACHVYCSPLVM